MKAIFNPQVEYLVSLSRAALGEIFEVLADPTRRAILERLSRGEARVTELAEPFPMSLNAVSKHIRVLEHARMVKRRRAGRDHFLSLNPEPLDTAGKWIDTQRSVWMSRLQALDAMLREEDREQKRDSRGQKMKG